MFYQDSSRRFIGVMNSFGFHWMTRVFSGGFDSKTLRFGPFGVITSLVASEEKGVETKVRLSTNNPPWGTLSTRGYLGGFTPETPLRVIWGYFP